MVTEPGVQAGAAPPPEGHTVPMPVPVPAQLDPLQQRGGPPFCGAHVNPGVHCPRESHRQPWLPTMQVAATPPPELLLLPLVPPLLPLTLLLPLLPLDPNAPKLEPELPVLLPVPPPAPLEPPQAAKVSALAPMIQTRPTTR